MIESLKHIKHNEVTAVTASQAAKSASLQEGDKAEAAFDWITSAEIRRLPIGSRCVHPTSSRPIARFTVGACMGATRV